MAHAASSQLIHESFNESDDNVIDGNQAEIKAPHLGSYQHAGDDLNEACMNSLIRSQTLVIKSTN